MANIDRDDIRAAAEKYKNWGKWGPDDEIGTLTINGNLLLQSNATNHFQLGADTVAGTDYDTIVLQDDDLTLDGTFNVDQEAGFDAVDGDYLLIDYGTGTLTDNDVVVTGIAGDYWIDTRTAGKVWLHTGELEPPPPAGTVVLFR